MVTSNVIVATGRRKTAVARIQLVTGQGKVEVNGRDFEDYFTTAAMKTLALQPLQTADSLKKFDVKVKAHGGGLVGQAGALSLALARALIQVDSALRMTLKKPGLLRRDPREKERKKAGQPGARKRFQFSKR
ncbi:MAG TPA: 30S ribosomal protein S9 [Candidatus Methylacidiphilales bacterium]|nr:30S ribosomal protein S9 [Candidatus Methylacidiphilales bacterium]